MRESIKKHKVEIVLMVLTIIYFWAECFNISDVGIVFAIKMGTFCITNSTWFLLTIPFATACIYRTVKDKHNICSIVTSLIWGIVLICKITVFIKSIRVYIEYGGKESYVYEILKTMFAKSQIIGRGMSVNEIHAVLPEYNTSLLFSSIMAQYGIIASVAIVSIIMSILAIILYTSRNIEGVNGVIIRTSCLTLLGIQLMNLFMNLRVIPFSSFTTFMPFCSADAGEMAVSFLLICVAIVGIVNGKNGVKTTNM